MTLPARDNCAAAERLGASVTLDVSSTTAAERSVWMQAATDGFGADIVIDCTGVPETFAESLKLVRYGGVVLEVGAFVDLGEVGVNPTADICTKNVTVIGVGGERATSYIPALRLMEQHLNDLPLGSILTHVVSLEDAAKGVELSQSDEATKVAVSPWPKR